MKIRMSEVPSCRSLEKNIRRKLDRTLYKLLEMDDDDIRNLITVDDERLTALRKQIKRKQSDPVEKATEKKSKQEQADKAAPEKIQARWRIDLLPHKLLWPIDRKKLIPIKLRAIVHFTGNRNDLESLGVQVRTQAQDIFTITGTIKQHTQVAAQAACLKMRTPRPVFPNLDEAMNQAEVDDVHTPRPVNPAGYTGDGILLGVIDSVLDVVHATFREAAAPHDSRVLYYWVQDPDAAAAPGQTPQAWSAALPAGSNLPDFNGLNYGRLYTQAAINAALGNAMGTYGNGANQISCEPEYNVDPWTGWISSEHGTHCAGIAAGNGMDGTWTVQADRVGAVPDAVIVYVQIPGIPGLITGDTTFEDHILDGIEFCRRIPDSGAHNMPIVISISQGTNFGPHDGTQLFDQARDNILNSWNNRSVVWSAGNGNDKAGSTSGTIGPGASVNFDLTGNWRGPTWLDIWFQGPDPRFRFTHAGVTSAWQPAGSNTDLVVNGHDIEVEWDLDTSTSMRGLRLYFPDSWLGTVYTIELENTHGSDTTTYYAWVGHQAWTANLSNFVDNSMTLSDTGCGKSILTVGACRKLFPPNPVSGETITDYSGAGPTADGRIKPEIVTVGGHDSNQLSQNQIWSAASDQASGWHPMHGTSMATPLVAGVVGLLLEEHAGLNRDVNQDEIKGLLIRHANRLNLDIDPSAAGFDREERNLYGNGRLRSIGAIDQVQPPAEVDLWVRTASDDYGLEPYPGDCFCQAPDIRVCTAGTDNEVTDITWNTTYDVKVRVRNLGDSPAVGTTVGLRYTYPRTAPNSWTPAEDASNNDCVETVTIDPMDDVELVFQWRPQQGEVTGAPAGQTHYCMLVEVDHPLDQLIYSAGAAIAGGAAWSTNIKGSNNVALQNLHIQ
jgi:subtilisin family serine protease